MFLRFNLASLLLRTRRLRKSKDLKNSSILFWLTCLTCGVLFSNQPSKVHAQQSAPRLIYPVGDFHVGKRLMFEGLTAAASHAFETSYRLSRTFNDQHGIDAVPTLCRNGQALYLNGDFTNALSNLNAGLALAYNCRFWTTYLDQIPIVLRPIEVSDGKIAWIVEERISRLAIYPDAWPVAIGSQTIFVESQEPNRQPNIIIEPIWLDAIETFLSQAIAIRTRNRLLGSLAKHYELTKQLESMYSQVHPRMPELLQRCQNVCHALTLSGSGRSKQAKNLLEQNLTLDSGFDFPLTSIALLELATIAIAEEDFTRAKLRAGQASLVAARLNQLDILAEALDLLTNCADYQQAGQGLQIAENVLRWADARFVLVYLTTLSNACQSAALSKNPNAFANYEAKLNRGLRIREVQLPHLQAALFASQIQIQQLRGNPANATASLQNLINVAIGDASPTGIVPQLLQATSIQIAMREGNMPKRILQDELASLVQRPTRPEWVRDPWGSLVWDNLPLNDLYSMLVTQSSITGNADEVIQLLSDWHERQLRVRNPIEERALALKRALQEDPTKLPKKKGDEFTAIQIKYHSMQTRLASINQRFDNLMATANRDGNGWSNELHREWSQIVNLCTSQSNDYQVEASAAIYLPDFSDTQIDFGALRSDLADHHAILGFFQSEDTLWGYLINNQESEYWVIRNNKQLPQQLENLLKSIGAYADIPTLLKSLESQSQWLQISTEISTALIPEKIRTKLSRVKRLSIVPVGKLWLLPFEMMTDGVALTTNTWQSKYAISYSLSLKSAAIDDYALPNNAQTVVYQRPNFYSVENQVDSALQKSVVDTLAPQNTTTITLTKENAAIHPFPIAIADNVIVASDFVLPALGGIAMLRQKDQSISIIDNALIDVMHPDTVLILDIQNQTAERLLQSPNEINRILQQQRQNGIRTILWRQWPVNGESSAITAREILTRWDRPLPAAMQSSLLSLWEIELNSTQEQRFSAPTRRGNAQLLSGKMPIFWAGWKVTTNSAVPTKSNNGLAERN